ncbi:type 1 glutamine amidotransferase [Antribacter sp. KLBMP9083]|uniref:Type 1 glutamine amidotransferase n=1 Tax=Antribacter soli TaxID=2910976 RepID=A0AA41QD80_9MICO|nr:type 1 glutamine amidotransferase [Antribacter soli]MCF4120009.1 type 1 glutamine amidotransferase [Antribacter soli]
MRVLVVQNSPTSGAGRLDDWLADAGIEPVLTPGDDLPPDLAGFAGLILLGGGFVPDDDERHPWLAHERSLVSAALSAEMPILGICLGAQLLAYVAGGTVTAQSGETERGMCALRVLPSAAGDPVFALLTEVGPLWMIQNHQDSVTALPAGAELLATSDACAVQAFRVGSSAWGLQFHPEVRPERIADWNEAALSAQGIDRAALATAALERADENATQAEALVRAWAEVVCAPVPK